MRQAGPAQEAADLAAASQVAPLSAACQRISRDAKAKAKARAKAEAQATAAAKAVAKAKAKAEAKPKAAPNAVPAPAPVGDQDRAALQALKKRVRSKAWHAEVLRATRAKMDPEAVKASAKLAAKAALQDAGLA